MTEPIELERSVCLHCGVLIVREPWNTQDGWVWQWRHVDTERPACELVLVATPEPRGRDL